MSFCCECKHYHTGGYCWKRHRDTGFLHNACDQFEEITKTINEMETKPTKPVEEKKPSKGRKTKAAQETTAKAPTVPVTLACYTDEALAQELRRRGYEGTLTKSIDLKKDGDTC